uniref:Genome polyprotein n=1 Tax=Insect associated flavi-like virus TaxID=3142495 RepID=A0AAT9JGE7_9FLAV
MCIKHNLANKRPVGDSMRRKCQLGVKKNNGFTIVTLLGFFGVLRRPKNPNRRQVMVPLKNGETGVAPRFFKKINKNERESKFYAYQEAIEKDYKNGVPEFYEKKFIHSIFDCLIKKNKFEEKSKVPTVENIPVEKLLAKSIRAGLGLGEIKARNKHRESEIKQFLSLPENFNFYKKKRQEKRDEDKLQKWRDDFRKRAENLKKENKVQWFALKYLGLNPLPYLSQAVGLSFYQTIKKFGSETDMAKLSEEAAERIFEKNKAAWEERMKLRREKIQKSIEARERWLARQAAALNNYRAMLRRKQLAWIRSKTTSPPKATVGAYINRAMASHYVNLWTTSKTTCCHVNNLVKAETSMGKDFSIQSDGAVVSDKTCVMHSKLTKIESYDKMHKYGDWMSTEIIEEEMTPGDELLVGDEVVYVASEKVLLVSREPERNVLWEGASFRSSKNFRSGTPVYKKGKLVSVITKSKVLSPTKAQYALTNYSCKSMALVGKIPFSFKDREKPIVCNNRQLDSKQEQIEFKKEKSGHELALWKKKQRGIRISSCFSNAETLNYHNNNCNENEQSSEHCEVFDVILPQGWYIEDDGTVSHRESRTQVKHRRDFVSTEYKHSKPDWVSDLEPITSEVKGLFIHIGEPGKNDIEYIEPFKINTYDVENGMYKIYPVHCFRSDKNYRSGTPIYNENGEFISVVTRSVKVGDRRLYAISTSVKSIYNYEEDLGKPKVFSDFALENKLYYGYNTFTNKKLWCIAKARFDAEDGAYFCVQQVNQKNGIYIQIIRKGEVVSEGFEKQIEGNVVDKDHSPHYLMTLSLLAAASTAPTEQSAFPIFLTMPTTKEQFTTFTNDVNSIDRNGESFFVRSEQYKVKPSFMSAVDFASLKSRLDGNRNAFKKYLEKEIIPKASDCIFDPHFKQFEKTSNLGKVAEDNWKLAFSRYLECQKKLEEQKQKELAQKEDVKKDIDPRGGYNSMFDPSQLNKAMSTLEKTIKTMKSGTANLGPSIRALEDSVTEVRNVTKQILQDLAVYNPNYADMEISAVVEEMEKTNNWYNQYRKAVEDLHNLREKLMEVTEDDTNELRKIFLGMESDLNLFKKDYQDKKDNLEKFVKQIEEAQKNNTKYKKQLGDLGIDISNLKGAILSLSRNIKEVYELAESKLTPMVSLVKNLVKRNNRMKRSVATDSYNSIVAENKMLKGVVDVAIERTKMVRDLLSNWDTPNKSKDEIIKIVREKLEAMEGIVDFPESIECGGKTYPIVRTPGPERTTYLFEGPDKFSLTWKNGTSILSCSFLNRMTALCFINKVGNYFMSIGQVACNRCNEPEPLYVTGGIFHCPAEDIHEHERIFEASNIKERLKVHNIIIMLTSVLSTIWVCERFGVVTSVVWLLLTMNVSTVYTCQLDATVYRAVVAGETGDKTVSEIRGKFVVGSCIQTEYMMIEIINITTTYNYMLTASALYDWSWSTTHDYRCPKGAEVFEKCDTDKSKTLIGTYEKTTTSYNKAFTGTSCFFEGNLEMHHCAYVHAIKTGKVYTMRDDGTKTTVTLKIRAHNGREETLEIDEETGVSSEKLGVLDVKIMKRHAPHSFLHGHSNYVITETSKITYCELDDDNKLNVQLGCPKIVVEQQAASVEYILQQPDRLDNYSMTVVNLYPHLYHGRTSSILVAAGETMIATIQVDDREFNNEKIKMCGAVGAKVLATYDGISKNYKYAIIETRLIGSNDNLCKVRVDCGRCFTAEPFYRQVTASTFNISILCGTLTAGTCNITMANGAVVVLDVSSATFRNPHLDIHQGFDKMMFHLEDSLGLFEPLQQISKLLGGLGNKILGFFDFSALYKKVLAAVAAVIAVGLFIKGNYIFSMLIILGTFVLWIPAVKTEPVCTKWHADIYGMQIPKLLAENNRNEVIHGIWNLPMKSRITCNKREICRQLGIVNITTWFDTNENDFGGKCGTVVHEYCKHGAHYGYTLVEYLSYLDLCENATKPYICRWNGTDNVLQETISSGPPVLGCRNGSAKRYIVHRDMLLATIVVVVIATQNGVVYYIALFMSTFVLSRLNNCMYNIGSVASVFSQQTALIRDQIASDYETVLKVADFVVDIFMTMTLHVFLGAYAIGVVFILKNTDAVYAFLVTWLKGSYLYVDYNRWSVSVLIAEIWPKKMEQRNEMLNTPLVFGRFLCHRQDNTSIAEHTSYGKVLLSELINNSECGLNNTYCGRFYYTLVSDNLIVPKHCVEIDADCIVENDLVVVQKSSGGGSFVIPVPKKQWKNGDSGYLYEDKHGKVIMHRGVINEESICVTEVINIFENHSGRGGRKQPTIPVRRSQANSRVPKRETSIVNAMFSNRRNGNVVVEDKTSIVRVGPSRYKIQTLHNTTIVAQDKVGHLRQQSERIRENESHNILGGFLSNLAKRHNIKVMVAPGDRISDSIRRTFSKYPECVSEITKWCAPKRNTSVWEAAAIKSSTTKSQNMAIASNLDRISNRISKMHITEHSLRFDEDIPFMTVSEGELYERAQAGEGTSSGMKLMRNSNQISFVSNGRDKQDEWQDQINLGETMQEDPYNGYIWDSEGVYNRTNLQEFDGCSYEYLQLIVYSHTHSINYSDNTKTILEALDKVGLKVFSAFVHNVWMGGDMPEVEQHLKLWSNHAKYFFEDYTLPKYEVVDLEFSRLRMVMYTLSRTGRFRSTCDFYMRDLQNVIQQAVRPTNISDGRFNKMMSIIYNELAVLTRVYDNSDMQEEADLVEKLVRSESKALRAVRYPLAVARGKSIDSIEDTWIYSGTYTTLMYLNRICNGVLGMRGGTVYTNYHVSLSNDILLNYYSSDGNSISTNKDNNVYTVKFVCKEYSPAHEMDFAHFSAPNLEIQDMKTPVSGKVYYVANFEEKTYATLMCRITNAISADGSQSKVNQYTVVDLNKRTKTGKPTVIQEFRRLKGWSGTPILDEDCSIVGIFGTSRPHGVSTDKSVQVVETPSLLPATSVDLRRHAENILLLMETRPSKRWQMVTGGTGCGKTTKLIMEIAKSFSKKFERQVRIAVAVPYKRLVDSLFDYMKTKVTETRESSYCVEIQKKHGDTDCKSSMKVPDTGKVIILYATYRTILTSERTFDMYILDEVHTRENSYALEWYLMKNMNYANVIAMTATPWISEYYEEYHLGNMQQSFSVSTHSFTLENYKKKDNNKSGEGKSEAPEVESVVTGKIPIIYDSTKCFWFNASDIPPGKNAIIFFPTISKCREAEKVIRKYATQDVVSIYGGYNGPTDLANTIICATNALESGITIPDTAVVIDFMKENKQLVELEKSENMITKFNVSFGLVPIDSKSQAQRKGRVGRTCEGKYFHLQTEVSTFNPASMSVITTAAMELLSVKSKLTSLSGGDPDLDELLDLLNPEHLASVRFWPPYNFGSRITRLSDTIDTLYYMEQKLQLAQSFKFNPVYMYLMPTIPEEWFYDSVISEIFNLDGNQDIGNIFECRNRLADLGAIEPAEHSIRRAEKSNLALNHMIIDKIYGFCGVDFNDPLSYTKLIKETLGKKTEKYELDFTIGAHMSVAVAAAVAIGAGHLYSKFHCSTRPVSAYCLKSNDIHQELLGFKYLMEKDYQLPEMAIADRIVSYLKLNVSNIKDLIYQTLRMLPTGIDPNGKVARSLKTEKYSLDSVDWEMIWESIKQFFIKVYENIEKFDWNNMKWLEEHLGGVGIGGSMIFSTFFSTMAENLGELPCTIIATLLLSYISSKVSAVGYIAISAINSIGYMIGNKAVGSHSNYGGNILTSIVLGPLIEKLLAPYFVTNDTTGAIITAIGGAATTISSSIPKTIAVPIYTQVASGGGLASGFLLVRNIINIFEGTNVDSNMTSKLSLYLSSGMSLYNMTSMNWKGWLAATITAGSYIVIKRMKGMLKSGFIATFTSAKSSSDKPVDMAYEELTDTQEWLETLYDIVNLFIGSVANPAAIPATILNVVGIWYCRDNVTEIEYKQWLKHCSTVICENPIVLLLTSGYTILKKIRERMEDRDGLQRYASSGVWETIQETFRTSFEAIREFCTRVLNMTTNGILQLAAKLIQWMDELKNYVSDKFGQVKNWLKENITSTIKECIFPTWLLTYNHGNKAPLKKEKVDITEYRRLQNDRIRRAIVFFGLQKYCATVTHHSFFGLSVSPAMKKLFSYGDVYTARMVENFMRLRLETDSVRLHNTLKSIDVKGLPCKWVFEHVNDAFDIVLQVITSLVDNDLTFHMKEDPERKVVDHEVLQYEKEKQMVTLVVNGNKNRFLLVIIPPLVNGEWVGEAQMVSNVVLESSITARFNRVMNFGNDNLMADLCSLIPNSSIKLRINSTSHKISLRKNNSISRTIEGAILSVADIDKTSFKALLCIATTAGAWDRHIMNMVDGSCEAVKFVVENVFRRKVGLVLRNLGGSVDWDDSLLGNIATVTEKDAVWDQGFEWDELPVGLWTSERNRLIAVVMSCVKRPNNFKNYAKWLCLILGGETRVSFGEEEIFVTSKYSCSDCLYWMKDNTLYISKDTCVRCARRIPLEISWDIETVPRVVYKNEKEWRNLRNFSMWEGNIVRERSWWNKEKYKQEIMPPRGYNGEGVITTVEQFCEAIKMVKMETATWREGSGDYISKFLSVFVDKSDDGIRETEIPIEFIASGAIRTTLEFRVTVESNKNWLDKTTITNIYRHGYTSHKTNFAMVDIEKKTWHYMLPINYMLLKKANLPWNIVGVVCGEAGFDEFIDRYELCKDSGITKSVDSLLEATQLCVDLEMLENSTNKPLPYHLQNEKKEMDRVIAEYDEYSKQKDESEVALEIIPAKLECLLSKFVMHLHTLRNTNELGRPQRTSVIREGWFNARLIENKEALAAILKTKSSYKMIEDELRRLERKQQTIMEKMRSTKSKIRKSMSSTQKEPGSDSSSGTEAQEGTVSGESPSVVVKAIETVVEKGARRMVDKLTPSLFKKRPIEKYNNDGMLTSLLKGMGIYEREYVEKEDLRHISKTERFMGRTAMQFAEKIAVKPMYDALRNEDKLEFSDKECLSILHFDKVSNRVLDPQLYKKSKWNSAAQCKLKYSKNIDRGQSIVPMSRQCKLTIAPSYSTKELQRYVDSLSHIKGKAWQVMKRHSRVELLTIKDMPMASRGYCKAALMDYDLGIFTKSRVILDLSAGYGGFAQYAVTTVDKTNTKEVYLNSLHLEGHAAPMADLIRLSSRNANNKIRILRGKENGDIRYKDTFELCKNAVKETSLDLIISDCGETHPDLKQEGLWMTKNITLQGVNSSNIKEKAISNNFSGALVNYIKLLAPGGTAVIKMLGFTENVISLAKLYSAKFSHVLMWKAPTASFQSREWYLVLLGYNPKAENQEEFQLEKLIKHAQHQWVQAFIAHKNWCKKNYNGIIRDLNQGTTTKFVPMKQVTWPLPLSDGVLKIAYHNNTRIIESAMIKHEDSTNIFNTVLNFEFKGVKFNSQLPARWSALQNYIRSMGYKIDGPSGHFKKVVELGKVNFACKSGKEKSNANMIIKDYAFNVFGLTKENSTIGTTQSVEDFLYQAWTKRLDIIPEEPTKADSEILWEAHLAQKTEEYNKIALGSDKYKFKPWTYERMSQEINNQGKGGHFDRYVNFKEAVADPDFRQAVEKRIQDLTDGKPVASYTTCRDKRETKAKKNISDGKVTCDINIDPRIAAYRKLSDSNRKEARRLRKEYLDEQSNLVPRNIRFTEFVQRAVDIMVLGPVQHHHNHIAKLNMGSTTGTPLWQLGDLVRLCYDAYRKTEEQEYAEHEKQQTSPKEVYIEMINEDFKNMRRDAIIKKKKVMVASGDFSGYDGTISKTDLAINCHSYLAIYQKKYHSLIINRFALYMWNFTITDYGHIVLTIGQRASGDQDTSKGNTEINDVVHTAATAVALGITCKEACEPIGYAWYKVGFGKDVRYKRFVLRRITHAADGDDNLHFGYEDDIRLLNKNGADFINRLGKALRCGTSAGYSLSSEFSEISFCSHSFERTRKGKIDGVPIEHVPYSKRPFNMTRGDKNVIFEKEYMESASACVAGEEWSLRRQHAFDKACGLKITYSPTRAYSEIIGKYTFTLKNEVVYFDPTRKYGNTKKEDRRANKNERAHEITRGKSLSYLLNYAHIGTVQIAVMAVLSIIGDGTCDLKELKRRFNVPSTTESVRNALRTVHGVDSLAEIERPNPHIERRELMKINGNTRLTFENATVDGVGKVAHTNILDLYKASRNWVGSFSDRFENEADYSFIDEVRPISLDPNVTDSNIKHKLPVLKNEKKNSMITQFMLNMLCCFGICKKKESEVLNDLPYREYSNVIFSPKNGEVSKKIRDITGVNVHALAHHSEWRVGDVIPVKTAWNTVYIAVTKNSSNDQLKKEKLGDILERLRNTVIEQKDRGKICFVLSNNKKIDRKISIEDVLRDKHVRHLNRSRSIHYFVSK